MKRDQIPDLGIFADVLYEPHHTLTESAEKHVSINYDLIVTCVLQLLLHEFRAVLACPYVVDLPRLPGTRIL